MSKELVERPFVCKTCAKKFTRPENLRRHSRQHTLIKFICPHCKKGYSRSDSLNIHIRRIHKLDPLESKTKKQKSFSVDGSGSIGNKTPSESSTTDIDVPIQNDDENKVLEEEEYKLPLDNLEEQQIHDILDLYWLNFDPSFPLLHKNSFKLPSDYSRDTLINVICSIGLRYYDQSLYYRTLSDDMFSYSLEQLETSHNNDFTIKYFQATLIAVYSGLFSGNDDWYKWSINNHSLLISLARENGMFQSDSNMKIDGDLDAFIITETRRRISYALYVIDGQLASLFNYPPRLSHYEIKHILPCSEIVWDSKDNGSWSSSKSELYFIDVLQQVLTKNLPKSISSFGAVVILLAIHVMIRNLTQFSGILDKNQSLHTQDPFSRRSQLGQALNALRGCIPRRKIEESLSSTNLKTMWDFFETNWNLAYIHLHLPDTVISSGIVEVTLDATIATAAELSKPHFNLGPGTVLLSNDYTQIPYETYSLVNSHILFFLRNFKAKFKETNPALTFMFYKVCLIAWQILKASSSTSNALNSLSNQIQSGKYTEQTHPANIEANRELLQKEYMMKRLADDIISHISIESKEINTIESEIKEFNKYVESLFYSYQIWGTGRCASLSFSELLSNIGEENK